MPKGGREETVTIDNAQRIDGGEREASMKPAAPSVLFVIRLRMDSPGWRGVKCRREIIGSPDDIIAPRC